MIILNTNVVVSTPSDADEILKSPAQDGEAILVVEDEAIPFPDTDLQTVDYQLFLLMILGMIIGVLFVGDRRLL